MAKPVAKAAKTRYVCSACGHAEPRWLGRCPDCDAWDCFVEEAAPAAPAGGRGASGAHAATTVVPLARVEQEAATRFTSGMPLLDRVLGGGVVVGGAVLLAGEPGIGKSTLLLQLAEALARGGRRVLYASAEESTRQLRLRAERLGCGHPDLLVAGETVVESILAAAAEQQPQVLVVDSIQAVHSAELGGLPGSVGQVRACAERLVEHAKGRRARGGGECALFLVGHVTKEGSIAGPKSLEHLVDTVLAFEAEGGGDHRVLRAAKNRFGPAGEVALYEMHDSGLVEVTDPSRVLLAQRRPEAPGSAVAATLHGSRPLLVEVQALVHASELPTPRRVSLGLDGGRVALLLAVLERFANASFAGRDVYLNVVGGLRLEEPAVDLAIAAALLSAVHERALPPQAAFFGEVGLLGEVRPVGRAEVRLREAAALGFHVAYAPKAEGVRRPRGMQVIEIEHVRELVGKL